MGSVSVELSVLGGAHNPSSLARIGACVHVHVCVCVCVYGIVDTLLGRAHNSQSLARICIYIYIYICVCVYMYIFARVCMRICARQFICE
jgi:hypothetical protein